MLIHVLKKRNLLPLSFIIWFALGVPGIVKSPAVSATLVGTVTDNECHNSGGIVTASQNPSSRTIDRPNNLYL
jgi:hypothetical protein